MNKKKKREKFFKVSTGLSKLNSGAKENPTLICHDVKLKRLSKNCLEINMHFFETVDFTLML